MAPIRRIESRAVALPRANVDTDQIVPARFLKKPRSDAYADFLFHDLRDDPAFGFPRGPSILVAGMNFGCGSSREQAVWALYAFGFRAVIAPSFGDIFANNALKNGLLPVALSESEVHSLFNDLTTSPGGLFSVDLEKQEVEAPCGRYAFSIPPFARHCLLEGIDELGYTLTLADRIAAFERRYET